MTAAAVTEAEYPGKRIQLEVRDVAVRFCGFLPLVGESFNVP